MWFTNNTIFFDLPVTRSRRNPKIRFIWNLICILILKTRWIHSSKVVFINNENRILFFVKHLFIYGRFSARILWSYSCFIIEQATKVFSFRGHGRWWWTSSFTTFWWIYPNRISFWKPFTVSATFSASILLGNLLLSERIEFQFVEFTVYAFIGSDSCGNGRKKEV